MFNQGGYGGNRVNMGNNDRYNRHGGGGQRDPWVNVTCPLCQVSIEKIFLNFWKCYYQLVV